LLILENAAAAADSAPIVRCNPAKSLQQPVPIVSHINDVCEQPCTTRTIPTTFVESYYCSTKIPIINAKVNTRTTGILYTVPVQV